jgi:hypothetical protein
MASDEETAEAKAREVVRLKALVNDDRREWDRLDAHGSESSRQSSLSASIDRCVKRIKDLTGEDY